MGRCCQQEDQHHLSLGDMQDAKRRVGLEDYSDRPPLASYQTLDVEGATYRGQTKELDGKEVQHGRGEQAWADGVVYVGDWVDGEPDGHGVKTKKEERWRYEGQWKQGARDGHGK